MKKFLRLITASVIVFSLALTPVVVRAEVVEEVDGTGDTTAPLPSTGGTEVAAPDTGIAPSSNVARNVAVFVGGSALGAAAGVGLVTLKKKKFEQ
jgi:hypothetical protein